MNVPVQVSNADLMACVVPLFSDTFPLLSAGVGGLYGRSFHNITYTVCTIGYLSNQFWSWLGCSGAKVGPDMGGQWGERCGCATLERGHLHLR